MAGYLLAEKEHFHALIERMKVLEKLVARRLAKENPDHKSPRGRYWAPPKRKPASGGEGVLTRDRLVLELQKSGMTFRQALRTVEVILNSMIEELKDGGEIRTALGAFRIVRRRKRKELQRFGHTVTVNQQPKRVAFRAARQLKADLRSAARKEISQKEIPMPEPDVANLLSCDKCGSLEFTEVDFRRHLDGYVSTQPGSAMQYAKEDVVYRILMCVCGNPIMPGRLRSYGNREAARSFQTSVVAALQYRETQLSALQGNLDDMGLAALTRACKNPWPRRAPPMAQSKGLPWFDQVCRNQMFMARFERNGSQMNPHGEPIHPRTEKTVDPAPEEIAERLEVCTPTVHRTLKDG